MAAGQGMENKTALIVDDSRTASHVLRRMLEKDQFKVDVRDSAEEAIEFLESGRPGVIFMDHMMPGLDGFQAVKAIKGKPETASIPIVMYTSKTGELYIGQARALGAADILHKPPTKQSLQEVFARLDAMEAQRLESPPEQEAAAVPNIAASEPVDHQFRSVAETPAPKAAPEPAAFVTIADDEPSGRSSIFVVFGAMLALFLLGVLTGRYFLAGSVPYRSIEWAISADPVYPYGEAPFSGSRVDLVRQLLGELDRLGFKGTVELQGHVGSFCLVSDGAAWRVAPPELPVESCELIGHGAREAMRMSGQQSREFRRMVASSPVQNDIQIDISPQGDTSPRVEYPNHREVKTAGDWNRIASQNNRIQVRLIPD